MILKSLNLIQYTSNKQKNPKCDVYTYINKLNVVFVIRIFRDHNVILPYSKKGSMLKLKELKIGNKNNVYDIHSLKLLDKYSMVGLKNNLLPSMRVCCRVIGLDCLIILL
jgi:hypothetical protein